MDHKENAGATQIDEREYDTVSVKVNGIWYWLLFPYSKSISFCCKGKIELMIIKWMFTCDFPLKIWHENWNIFWQKYLKSWTCWPQITFLLMKFEFPLELVTDVKYE